MRQDCCGILPTFLSFGTHQGETTPYVTANQKPLRAFNSLSPQRNVSFPQRKKNKKHENKCIILQIRKDLWVMHHLVEEASLELDVDWRVDLYEVTYFHNWKLNHWVRFFSREEFGCFGNIHVQKRRREKIEKNKRAWHCLFLLCCIVYLTIEVYNKCWKSLAMVSRTPGMKGKVYIMVAGVRRHIGIKKR